MKLIGYGRLQNGNILATINAIDHHGELYQFALSNYRIEDLYEFAQFDETKAKKRC